MAWTMTTTAQVRHELPAGAAAGRARRALRPALLRQRQRLGRPQRPRRQPHQVVPGTDKPIAGLLADLKARGLLDSTLVVWGGEFGRTPFNEKGNGRDHNPWGFTMWMAGGGVQARRSRSARPTRSACAPWSGPRTSTTSTPRFCISSA